MLGVPYDVEALFFGCLKAVGYAELAPGVLHGAAFV